MIPVRRPAYETPHATAVERIAGGLAERVALAQAVQRAFLPERTAMTWGSLSLRARNELCEDASGDYYDFVPLEDGRVVVAIGDVTGHGLGPALLMAQGRAFLRAFCRAAEPLGAVVGRVNDALSAEMTQGRFMSLFVAAIDPSTGAMSWCNAGHVPALLHRARTGETKALGPTGVVLGAFPGFSFHAEEGLSLEPGDSLLLCSDGATEARRPDGTLFGLDGMIKALERTPTGDADAVLEGVQEALDGWTEGRRLDDDLTLVSITRTGCELRLVR